MKFELRDELKRLVEETQGPCVSIYMPTHPFGIETQQDPIRLANLIREAEKQLIGLGLRSPEARRLLKPVQQLERDGFFWRRQADGLAVFVSPDLFRTYRVPFHFHELAIVADRFHFKPLLPLFNGDGSFYVLALSQKQVRLLQCTRYGVNEVELENVPKSIDEALKYDDPEEQLRYHTISPAPNSMGTGVAMFHGHGVGIDDAKINLWRYFLKVNDGLHEVLREEQAPMVLAAVDYLIPIYKEVNTYAHLFDGGITGNPEGLSSKELHEQAWAVVGPHFQKTRKDAAAKYHELAGTGLTSSDIKEIVPAAWFGRVESLFLSAGLQQWGAFDPSMTDVQLHENAEPGNEDLVDTAAVRTFLNRGAVYIVEPENVPGGEPAAAVFRY